MNFLNLEDRLYTSTEVADILGVSLRSVYRYLEEDKIRAEVKTATGRHRFTKQNILDFLYPQGAKIPTEVGIITESPSQKSQAQSKQEQKEQTEPAEAKPAKQKVTPQTVEEVDWLSKFRDAANKFKSEEQPTIAQQTMAEESIISQPAALVEEEPEKKDQFLYYRSNVGGLRDIAQNIDKSARKSLLDYAFTMHAGMSLHKPIKPFSLLHSYVRSKDKEFFEKVLGLTPVDKSSAQLCLVATEKNEVFDSKKEMHGLYVVSDMQLRADLSDNGYDDLVSEFDSLLRSK